jgi:hypothetical protein
MKIKFLQSHAGINFHFSGGQVYDLPPDEAAYWIREGAADIVEEENQETRPLVVQEVKKPATRPVKKTVKKA